MKSNRQTNNRDSDSKKKLESDLTNDELIRSLKQEGYSVSQVCKVLKLPESSYYRRALEQTKTNQISDKKAARIQKEVCLVQKIKEIKADHQKGCQRQAKPQIKSRGLD